MLAFAVGAIAGAAAAAGAALWLYRRQQSTMGRFFSFAAHEINTPITAVNMTILNLLSGVFGDVPPDQVQWIEMMREQVVRLSGMVGELRDIIHLSMHDDLLVHAEDVEVKELVETALRAVRYGCAHSGVGIDAAIPEGLPAVHADPDRLPRCLTSLLFHARKFRTVGPLIVSASPSENGRFVEFVTEFHGPPLSEEEARLSLDLYFPAQQRGDKSMTSTGLGLGIVRDLARLQGGDLQQETDGKGKVRLRLTVPAAKRAQVAPAAVKDL